MTRNLRRWSTLALSVSLVAAGLAVAAPALAAIPGPALPPGVTVTNAGTAVDPTHEVSIDCEVLPSEGGYARDVTDVIQLPVPLDGGVTVTTVNCGAFTARAQNTSVSEAVPQFRFVDGPAAGVTNILGVDFADTDLIGLTGTQFVVSANTAIRVVESGTVDVGYFEIEAVPAVPVANPSGSLLQEFVMEIPADAQPNMVFTDDPSQVPPGYDGPMLAAGGCGIDTGQHIVVTQTVVIDRAGSYTFRVADVTPIVQDIDQTQPFRYLGDPFLALYSTYTPENPQSGLLGCDDDSDLDLRTDYYITGAGTMMTDRFPQFTVDLQPGTYTLVLTGYDSVSGFSASTEASASATVTTERADDPEKSALTPVAFGVDETGTVQLWGPAAPTELAATGPSALAAGAMGFGLALMIAGALLFSRTARR